ncbi:MAG: alpha-amylase family glycosyl hydrolase [Stutzerimonas stutzeri]
MINHTSDQHPWFQAARAGAEGLAASATSTSGATPTTRLPGARASSSWTSRRPTGPGMRWPRQYYWHRFYSHQPDLNFDNPAGARGGVRHHAFLAGHGRRRACGSTPFPICSSATAPTTTTCRRRMRC